MKHRAIAQNFIMALYLVAVFWFAFNLTGMMDSLALNAANVRASLGWRRPPCGWATPSSATGRRWASSRCRACCRAPWWSTVWASATAKVVSAFAAKSARSDYRLTAQRSSGCFRALLAKETRRYFARRSTCGTPALGPGAAGGSGRRGDRQARRHRNPSGGDPRSNRRDPAAALADRCRRLGADGLLPVALRNQRPIVQP